MRDEPHEQRRGWLKNGNAPGDFTKAPRCGARTRRGTGCQSPAMPNGRCRLHGGLSTGPRTPDGLERSRKARWKHGFYSREWLEARRDAWRRWRDLQQATRDLGLRPLEGRGPNVYAIRRWSRDGDIFRDSAVLQFRPRVGIKSFNVRPGPRL
jgi:hypothetical protein